jgi:hypothetical protein
MPRLVWLFVGLGPRVLVRNYRRMMTAEPEQS